MITQIKGYDTMYNVKEHENDYDTVIENTKICDLGKMGKWEVQLWEHTFCAFHFLFTIRYSRTGWADYSEKEFLSAKTALEWFEKEKKRRDRSRKEYQRKRYWAEHKTGFRR